MLRMPTDIFSASAKKWHNKPHSSHMEVQTSRLSPEVCADDCPYPASVGCGRRAAFVDPLW